MRREPAESTSPTNPFVVLGKDKLQQGLETIAALDQPRKKRAHRKSRQGCVECRRRRVKCDENFPCSNCIKRHDRCVRPAPHEQVASGPSSPRLETSEDPQINLLHLQLLHHFENETVPTLAFAQIWPEVMRYAFHEDFVMSTLLCLSAAHLTTLRPQDPRYPAVSAQLLSKSLRLLRQNLSRPFTKDNCIAFLGTSVLVNYITWCNLGYLRGQPIDDFSTLSHPRLDLSQDQLFLLSPGVLQVTIQALPVFVREPGRLSDIFIQIARHRPLHNIVEALEKSQEDPLRFVDAFMRLWDDPRYQTHGDNQAIGATLQGSPPRSWRFCVELEIHGVWEQLQALLPDLPPRLSDDRGAKRAIVTAIAATPSAAESTDICTARLPWPGSTRGLGYTTALYEELPAFATPRAVFERIVSRLSPILCYLSPSTRSNPEVTMHPAAKQRKADFHRLLFVFPVFCCGPVLEMIVKGDSRALVLLFHFYRAVRVLLSSEEAWWAQERSRVMEGLILNELKTRGLCVCLRD